MIRKREDDQLDQILEKMDRESAFELLCGKRITEEEVEKVQFSERYQHKMEQLANRYAAGEFKQESLEEPDEEKPRRRLAPRRRIAAMLAVCFVGVIAFAVTADAFSFNFLKEIWNFITGHVAFTTESNIADDVLYEGKIPYEWDDLYLPTYMTEGFEIDEDGIEKSINSYRIIFIRNSDKITFKQSPLDEFNAFVDTEDADIEKEKIGMVDGFIIQKNGRCQISWQNNEFYFQLVGPLDKEEMLKIASSVAPR